MPKKTTKKQIVKSINPKETKSTTTKKSNNRRKKESDESEEEFKADDYSDDNSDIQEEIEIKKKLAKIDEGSDFEPLEPWEDDKPAKKRTKKVKKTDSGRSTAQNSTTKSTSTSKGSSTKKVSDTKTTKKGPGKARIVGNNLRIKFQDEDKEDDGNFFPSDEHPQFDESCAYIPNFLVEPHIRDKEGKYSNEEGYDPTTLLVPPEDLKNFRPLLRQYWEIKSKHYDKLVGIKVWKFYYFYFHDALIVHRIIDMN